MKAYTKAALAKKYGISAATVRAMLALNPQIPQILVGERQAVPEDALPMIETLLAKMAANSPPSRVGRPRKPVAQ